MCTTWNQKWKNWIRLYLFLMSSIHWCHKEIFPRQVQMAPDIFWNKNWRELRRWISVSLHLYHWVKVPVILRVKTKVFHQNWAKYPVSSLCIWTYHFVEKIFWNHPRNKIWRLSTMYHFQWSCCFQSACFKTDWGPSLWSQENNYYMWHRGIKIHEYFVSVVRDRKAQWEFM